MNVKDGFSANHLTWTVDELLAKAKEIASVADDLHAITAVFEFDAVTDPTN